jgi:hypothetical protein
MSARITLGLVLVASVLACGSSSSSKDDAKNAQGGGGGGSAANPVSGGGGGGGGGGEGTNAAPTIVFNEVLAVGTSEWIEIVNPGAATIDVSDYAIAGSKKDSTEPKTGSAMRFPAGTTIEPGARILIMTSKAKEDGVGPYTKEGCLPEGPETCFWASFGVSATAGETLHFLAPDDAIIMSTAIPMGVSAEAGASTTISQCRLPDVTGDFAPCAITPGQPNRGQ